MCNWMRKNQKRFLPTVGFWAASRRRWWQEARLLFLNDLFSSNSVISHL